MKNFRDILESEEKERWFLRWLTLRYHNKKLVKENEKLKETLSNQEKILSVYKKDEEFRFIKQLKVSEKADRKRNVIQKRKEKRKAKKLKP